MSIHTQPAAIDSVKKSLVALKMPRALEMLDATLRRVEQGEVTWIEALDQLLIEELTLRDNRRVSTALRMSRLTTVKTLAHPKIPFLADKGGHPRRIHDGRFAAYVIAVASNRALRTAETIRPERRGAARC
jgi:hypothetical protein